jgi:hypothetical protein
MLFELVDLLPIIKLTLVYILRNSIAFKEAHHNRILSENDSDMGVVIVVTLSTYYILPMS